MRRPTTHRPLLALTAATALAFPFAIALQPANATGLTPSGEAFQVNLDSAEDQSQVAVASSNDGNFFAVATNFRRSPLERWRLTGHHLSCTDQTTFEVGVSTFASEKIARPDVTAGSMGDFFAVWDKQTSRFTNDVFGASWRPRVSTRLQFFAFGGPGEIATSAVPVFDRATDDGTNIPAVVTFAGLSSPTGLVVRGCRQHALLEIGEFESTNPDCVGSPTNNDSQFAVSTSDDGNQANAAACSDAAGNYVVVWESENRGAHTTTIRGQRLANDRSKIGTEFAVGAAVGNLEGHPQVCCADNGRFVVAWEAAPFSGPEPSRVAARRFAADGNPAGAEFPLSRHSEFYDLRPRLDCDGDGNFVAAWTRADDSQPAEPRIALMARAFLADGRPAADEIEVTQDGLVFNERNADVALADDGELVVVWADAEIDGDGFGVAGRCFDFDTTGAPPTSTTSTTLSTNSTTTMLGASTTSTTFTDGSKCAQPITDGPLPKAVDCLYVLNAAVALLRCEPECICAPKGSLPPTAVDVLLCLNVATGAPGFALDCPC